jgi:hypothetical protein
MMDAIKLSARDVGIRLIAPESFLSKGFAVLFISQSHSSVLERI